MNYSIFCIENNENCYADNIKLDKNNYKKNRTISNKCYNEKKRKNKNNNTLIQNQQPNIDNVNNNNRTLLVGPPFAGKIYLMLKILSLIPSDNYIITKSPPEQHSTSKSRTKQIGEEMKPPNK